MAAGRNPAPYATPHGEQIANFCSRVFHYDANHCGNIELMAFLWFLAPWQPAVPTALHCLPGDVKSVLQIWIVLVRNPDFSVHKIRKIKPQEHPKAKKVGRIKDDLWTCGVALCCEKHTQDKAFQPVFPFFLMPTLCMSVLLWELWAELYQKFRKFFLTPGGKSHLRCTYKTRHQTPFCRHACFWLRFSLNQSLICTIWKLPRPSFCEL